MGSLRGWRRCPRRCGCGCAARGGARGRSAGARARAETAVRRVVHHAERARRRQGLQWKSRAMRFERKARPRSGSPGFIGGLTARPLRDRMRRVLAQPPEALRAAARGAGERRGNRPAADPRRRQGPARRGLTGACPPAIRMVEVDASSRLRPRMPALMRSATGAGEAQIESRAKCGSSVTGNVARLEETFLWHRYSHSRARISPELARQGILTMWPDQCCAQSGRIP